MSNLTELIEEETGFVHQAGSINGTMCGESQSIKDLGKLVICPCCLEALGLTLDQVMGMTPQDMGVV